MFLLENTDILLIIYTIWDSSHQWFSRTFLFLIQIILSFVIKHEVFIVLEDGSSSLLDFLALPLFAFDSMSLSNIFLINLIKGSFKLGSGHFRRVILFHKIIAFKFIDIRRLLLIWVAFLNYFWLGKPFFRCMAWNRLLYRKVFSCFKPTSQ